MWATSGFENGFQDSEVAVYFSSTLASSVLAYPILDIGINYHTNRVLAAFKGVLNAEIEIPYNEDFFPENFEEKIQGVHVENYAKILKSDEPEKYEKIFSGYIKKDKINPLKFSQIVASTFKSIGK